MHTVCVFLKEAETPHPALLRVAIAEAGMTIGGGRISEDTDFDLCLSVSTASDDSLVGILGAQGWRILPELSNEVTFEIRCTR